MGKDNTVKNLVIAGIVTMILFYIPLLFLPGKTLVMLTDEDSFYENFSAIFYFVASLLFFWIFFKDKRHNIFYLLFALAFVFAAGEEIDWGQRILQFQIPAAIAAENAQHEFNIHNLNPIQHEHGLSGTFQSLMNFNRVFIMFWFTYCILVPLAFQYWQTARKFLEKIRLPIIPIWFGFMFFLNEVMCKLMEVVVVAPLPYDIPVAEIKEALWALFLTLMGVYFLSRVRSEEAVLAREAV